MNLPKLKGAGIALLTLTTLAGCVDDNYDLSDIDTTAGIRVNDLVVPVNIDAVTLGSVIDLKEGESIEIVNGQYAVVKTGDFTSSSVNIRAIAMEAPSIESTSHDCKLIPGTMNFDISSKPSGFSYRTSDVTDCIVSIEEIGTHWTLTINMRIRELYNSGATGVTATVEDLLFVLPKGLSLAHGNENYDPRTGLYHAGTHDFVNGQLSISIEATSMNAIEAGVEYDYATHTASLEGTCAVHGGTLHLANQGGYSTLHIDSDYRMSEITATSFTGEIQYDIEGCDFNDVDLSSLPDFLSQTGTDIRLANPQIYLNVDNPLNRYSLTAETGLTITAFDNGGKRGSYSLDAPGHFYIDTDPAKRTYDFCLSPTRPDEYYVDGDMQWVGYSALGNVLSGNGIPSRLKISLDNPKLPVQRVQDLQLGTGLGAVTGKYTFYAPLALADGSTIAYTGTMDGWSSEYLDAVTISALTVTATADSDLPVDAELTAYPIDKEGNRIGDVEISGAHLKAMAKGEPITMTMTGTVRMLDGLRYEVRVKQEDSKTLTPEMSIKLSNVRARVTGEYVKKL